MQHYQIPRIVTIRSIHTAFHRFYEKGYNFKGETHNFWELVFISEGKAAIAKDNRIFNLGAGDLAFHPPMEFHRIWSAEEGFKLLVISFSASGGIARKLSEGIFTLEKKQQEALIALLSSIQNAFTMDDFKLQGPGDSPLAMQQAVNRLELFLLDILQMESSEKKISQAITAREFAHVIEVMQQHIDENLSVPQLAHLANLSLSNLKKIFKMYTGTGAGKYFLNLKINRAVHLLSGGMSVAETSEQLGFSTPGYFSFVFHRETGKTPGEFKVSG